MDIVTIVAIAVAAIAVYLLLRTVDGAFHHLGRLLVEWFVEWYRNRRRRRHSPGDGTA